MNCDQITMYDVESSNRDATLEARVSELETGKVTVQATRISSAGAPRMSETLPSVSSISNVTSRGGSGPQRRRGKAPPVDPFSAENPEVRLDDWLVQCMYRPCDTTDYLYTAVQYMYRPCDMSSRLNIDQHAICSLVQYMTKCQLISRREILYPHPQ